jgi:ComF family protein
MTNSIFLPGRTGWRSQLARGIFALTHRGAAWVAPPLCCLCGGPGQSSDASPWGLDLCAHCEAACPRLQRPCPRCALPLPAGSLRVPCASCAVRPPPFDAVWATHAYAPPLDGLVRDLKFQGALPHARVLGMLLAGHRRRGGQLPDAVVPVPLGRSRFADRGFNQAEEIARHAARHLGLRLRPGLLRRTRDTEAQSGLGADARRSNLAHAFSVGRARLPARIALVDDVLTTGSTATAAARTLKEAGAAWVEVWVAARALPRDPRDAGG